MSYIDDDSYYDSHQLNDSNLKANQKNNHNKSHINNSANQ